jgi:transcription initiation factor TFIID TATA-box-binding protein
MIKQQIVNVVATAALNQEIDFEKLRNFKEIFHDSDVYGGRVAYFKTDQMEGKVSIFLSGKMISIGTKSEAKAQEELLLAKQFLVDNDLIKDVDLQPITQNIVTTADFEHQINLEDFSEKTRAIYEPEQFAGAILKINEPFKTSILIFATGKTIITGLKSSDQIEPTIKQLKELIGSNA